MDQPESLGELEVRFVPSLRAFKEYTCPSCNRPIPPRTAHYVVVPVEDPDLRRHWHRGCWERRNRR